MIRWTCLLQREWSRKKHLFLDGPALCKEDILMWRLYFASDQDPPDEILSCKENILAQQSFCKQSGWPRWAWTFQWDNFFCKLVSSAWQQIIRLWNPFTNKWISRWTCPLQKRLFWYDDFILQVIGIIRIYCLAKRIFGYNNHFVNNLDDPDGLGKSSRTIFLCNESVQLDNKTLLQEKQLTFYCQLSVLWVLAVLVGQGDITTVQVVCNLLTRVKTERCSTTALSADFTIVI